MDETIQKAINKTRLSKKRGKRTVIISMRVSPEEKRIIDKRFGNPAAMRDFALGISAAAAVDFFIDDYRERISKLEEFKKLQEKEKSLK